MLWLGPHLYQKGSLNAHTLPAIEGEGGIQWRGGGGGIIFSTDPVGVGQGRNWPRVHVGLDIFLCAYHIQVCGLGPHLHEYKCIYEHRCDKTCLQGF